MNYQTWLAAVPPEITQDKLWLMEVYRIALFIGDLAWLDIVKLSENRRMIRLSDQLFAAAGSISANIAEGYGRGSTKDQIRFYEYSLGSARETRNWYFQSRFVLGEPVASHRIRLVTSSVRQLLTIIPSERGYKLREDDVPYASAEDVDLQELLNNVPLPDSPAPHVPRTTHHA